MNYELRITNKLFTVFVLVAVILSQAGFVLAVGGPVPAGGICDANDECEDTCCCCPADGCDENNKGVCGNSNCSDILCPFSKHRSLYSLVSTMSNYIFYIGLVLAPLMIVIGAFLFMASGGDPARSQLGKKIIIWAIIGLVFILFAKSIGSIISDLLFGSG